MSNSINDNLPPPSRPGLGYLFGALVVVAGVVAIMLLKGGATG
jgi:hypothetical protein